VFGIAVYEQQFHTALPSNFTDFSPLTSFSMANQTGESAVTPFGSSQALMEALIGESQKPGKVDRMVEECDLLETDKTLEGGKEQVKCTNRI